MMHKDYKIKRPKPPKTLLTLEYTKRMATSSRSTLYIYLCYCSTLNILMDKLSFNTLNTHIVFFPKGEKSTNLMDLIKFIQNIQHINIYSTESTILCF
jgi:hypothetical protein